MNTCYNNRIIVFLRFIFMTHFYLILFYLGVGVGGGGVERVCFIEVSMSVCTLPGLDLTSVSVYSSLTTTLWSARHQL